MPYTPTVYDNTPLGLTAAKLNKGETALVDHDSRITVVSEVVAAGTGVGATDRAVLQAAINAVAGRRGGRVTLRPDTDYALDVTLTLPASVILGNDRPVYNGASILGPRLLPASGVDAITFTATGGEYEFMGGAVEGLAIVGGKDAIHAPNGAVGMAFRRLQLSAQTGYQFRLPGFIQECDWDDVDCASGLGFYAPNTVGSGGADALFDKNTIKKLYCHGQTAGQGVFVDKPSGYSNIWELPRMVNIAGNGFDLRGAMTGHTILGYNAEANGWLPGGVGTKVARAVGAMTASASPAVLTLTAANPGYIVGDTLTVMGAGYDGADHSSVILSIANGAFTGSLITLTDIALNTVSGAEVTKAIYSDIVLKTSAAGTPSRITFIDALVGGDLPTADTKYGADVAGAAKVTFVNGHTFLRPVYDPLRTVATVGGTMLMRRPYSGAREQPGVTFGTSPPLLGSRTYERGEVVYNDQPTAGGTIGWVCTTAGAPGTWKTFGAITA